ncbi:MAG: tetratricopeptide repeat protein [Ignavibacteriales bacterium]|nr:tetratricopeptide repeat protein [Ignavibacteriales bacterium]
MQELEPDPRDYRETLLSEAVNTESPQMNKTLSVFRTYWKQLFILSLCTLFIYGITVTYDFVNYDDYYLVSQNESFLKNPGNIIASFSTSAFTSWRQESIYYRPILLISYILDYQIWKLNPAGYHATNIILHLITVAFIFFLFNSLSKQIWLALIAALFFAVHPINVESVAWIAGRNDILLALFVVLMIYWYHLHYEVEEKSNRYFILSVVAFSLALFTKESAAFYLALIPLYELVIKKEPLQLLFTKIKIKKFSLLLSPLIIYLLIRILLLGKMIGAEEMYGKLPFWSRVQILPAILTENIKLLLAPINLSVEHPLDQLLWLESPWNIIALIVTITLSILFIFSLRQKNVFSFALLWIGVGLIPSLNIIPLAVPILEHRLYTPMVGFAFVFVTLISSINIGKNFLTTRIAVILLVIAFTISSFLQVPVWKNSESLWLNAIEKAPTASRSYFNLAGHYFDKQEYDRSIILLKKYIELKPDDFLGYSKLRQTYYISGKIPEAVSVCRTLISLEPKNENRYIELAALFEQLSLPDSAINTYLQALNKDSISYRIHERLGLLYANLNNRENAIQSLLQSVRIKPDYASAYFNLGKIYSMIGKTDSALIMIERGESFGKIPTDMVQLKNILLGSKSDK